MRETRKNRKKRIEDEGRNVILFDETQENLPFHTFLPLFVFLASLLFSSLTVHWFILRRHFLHILSPKLDSRHFTHILRLTLHLPGITTVSTVTSIPITHTYFRSSQTQDGCNFWKKIHTHPLHSSLYLYSFKTPDPRLYFTRKTQEILTLRIIMHYFTGTTFTSFLLSTFYRLHPRSDWLSLLLNQLHIHWRHTMRR